MRIVNVFISIWIICLVTGATITMAAKPVKLWRQMDSNVNLLRSIKKCPQEPDAQSQLTLLMDLSADTTLAEDQLAMEMMNEAHSRHVAVQVLVPDLDEKSSLLRKYLIDHRCQFTQITHTTEEQQSIIATTFDAVAESATDLVEVLQTCEIHYILRGGCMLVSRPREYVEQGVVNHDRYQLFMKNIMAMGVLAAR